MFDLQADFSGSAKEGGIKHCLQLQDAAALNPVAYLNGLAQAITGMGGKIFESTRVRKPDRSVLETEAGNKVKATKPFPSLPAQIISFWPDVQAEWFVIQLACKGVQCMWAHIACDSKVLLLPLLCLLRHSCFCAP